MPRSLTAYNWRYFFARFIFYYLLITVVVYFASDILIFPVSKSSYQDIPQALTFKADDETTLIALFLKNPKAKYTILYSHGNAEDLGDILPFLKEYSENGFSIFAYDYHGYGKSEGRPSENKSYLDIQAAYRYLTGTLGISPKYIILHGRSIGTGPTIDLAAKTKVAGVILESPMLTAFRVITNISLFPVDKYENNKKIKGIKAPILFIHAKKDEIIPFWHGQALFDLAENKKRFYLVEEAGHNDLVEIAGKHYWQNIINFADSLPTSASN